MSQGFGFGAWLAATRRVASALSGRPGPSPGGLPSLSSAERREMALLEAASRGDPHVSMAGTVGAMLVLPSMFLVASVAVVLGARTFPDVLVGLTGSVGEAGLWATAGATLLLCALAMPWRAACLHAVTGNWDRRLLRASAELAARGVALPLPLLVLRMRLEVRTGNAVDMDDRLSATAWRHLPRQDSLDLIRLARRLDAALSRDRKPVFRDGDDALLKRLERVATPEALAREARPDRRAAEAFA